MDSKKFAKLAITHFTNVGCYSEIEMDKLEGIFQKHVEVVYSKKVDLISLMIETDRKNGEPWTTARYEGEMELLQKEMSVIIKELLAETTPSNKLLKSKKKTEESDKKLN